MPGRAAIALAAVGLLGLGGCGSGAPSEREFIAEADPVCARTGEPAAAVAPPADQPALLDGARTLANAGNATADGLGRLEPPDGGHVTALIKSIRDASRTSLEVQTQADDGDYAAVERFVSRAAAEFAEAEAKADRLGLAECVRREAAAAQRLAAAAPAIAKAAFLAEADKLCAAAGAAIDAIPEPQAFPEVKAYLDQTVAIAEKLTNDIKATPGPSTDKAALDEAIAANDAALAKIKEAQAAAAAGDEAATTALLDETIALSDAADAKADAYGFKDCGSAGA